MSPIAKRPVIKDHSEKKLDFKSDFHSLHYVIDNDEHIQQSISSHKDLSISDDNIEKLVHERDKKFEFGPSISYPSHGEKNSIPDVSRVFDCINRVLHLSRYIPSNVSFEKVYSPKDIIAVIPAYNEELTIGMVVLLSLQYVERVIVVDDGSKDRTAELAWLSGADVVQLDKNQGKARAVMAGFKRAREIGCSALVMLDADGQHNPSEIPDLLSPILSGNADLVIGSRHMMGEDNDTPSYRRIGQKTLDLATNMDSSFKSTDSQSGFRAFSKKAIETFDFPSEGYNIESDMIAYYSRIGLAIIEVPITARYEVPFKHKKNPLTHGCDVFAHIIGVIGYRRPLLTFGLAGFICAVIGIVFGFMAFDQYNSTGKFGLFFTMFTGMSMILGLLLITTGLILNSLVKIVKIIK